MKVISQNKEISLPIKIDTYDTFFKRSKGLMFRLKPIKNEGILIAPCNSIHMFFMFFSIDVVFINKQNEVVFTKEHVKPWTAIFPIKDAYAVLELPVGTIKHYSINKGNKIELSVY